LKTGHGCVVIVPCCLLVRRAVSGHAGAIHIGDLSAYERLLQPLPFRETGAGVFHMKTPQQLADLASGEAVLGVGKHLGHAA
jgi:hypothetical protein